MMPDKEKEGDNGGLHPPAPLQANEEVQPDEANED